MTYNPSVRWMALAVLFLGGCAASRSFGTAMEKMGTDAQASAERNNAQGRACSSNAGCDPGEVCANTDKRNLSAGRCVTGVR